MKILQINCVYNTGSTGKIVRDISDTLICPIEKGKEVGLIHYISNTIQLSITSRVDGSLSSSNNLKKMNPLKHKILTSKLCEKVESILTVLNKNRN